MHGSGPGGLFRGLFRMAAALLKTGFNITKPHLKTAAKNTATDVISNVLSRACDDRHQDSSDLMVMAHKRMCKPTGVRRRGHSIKKKKSTTKETSLAREKRKKTVRQNDVT